VITTGNKTVLTLGSFTLLASVFAAAFYAEPFFLFIPLLLVGGLLLIQYPAVLFYALLFSIPWSTEVNITESLGTDLPDEPLMLLMAFTVIALLLVQQKRQKQQWKFSPLLLLLFLSFCWSAISVALSTYFAFSLKYLLAKAWYLLAFALAPLVLNGDKKIVRRSAVVLFSSMFLVTCVSLVKHAAYNFTFANINDALAPFFRNHVNYSALLVFMVPLQLAFLRVTRNKTLRFLTGFSLLIVLAALALSYARGAWLALVIGMLAFWLIKKNWLLKSYLLALFFTGCFVYWLQHNDHYLAFAPEHDTTIFHKDFGQHLIATYEGKDVSTAERFYRWVAGVRMSGERWATGFGPTTFYQHYKSYTLPLFRTWVSDNREQSTVHNYFLLLLIEQGIFGLLIFLLLIGVLFWQAQKIYQRTADPFWKITVAVIASILWMQCTVNFLSDLIETDKVGSVFYLCLAFLVIADRMTRIETNYTN
jgi:O-antigen ligase